MGAALRLPHPARRGRALRAAAGRLGARRAARLRGPGGPAVGDEDRASAPTWELLGGRQRGGRSGPPEREVSVRAAPRGPGKGHPRGGSGGLGAQTAGSPGCPRPPRPRRPRWRARREPPDLAAPRPRPGSPDRARPARDGGAANARARRGPGLNPPSAAGRARAAPRGAPHGAAQKPELRAPRRRRAGVQEAGAAGRTAASAARGLGLGELGRAGGGGGEGGRARPRVRSFIANRGGGPRAQPPPPPGRPRACGPGCSALRGAAAAGAARGAGWGLSGPPGVSARRAPAGAATRPPAGPAPLAGRRTEGVGRERPVGTRRRAAAAGREGRPGSRGLPAATPTPGSASAPSAPATRAQEGHAGRLLPGRFCSLARLTLLTRWDPREAHARGCAGTVPRVPALSPHVTL